MRRTAFVCLVLAGAACGGGTTTDSTGAASPDTSTPVITESTPVAAEAPTTTTTTPAETTTTAPLDPIDSLAAAAEERSIAIDRELLESATGGLCTVASEVPEGSSLEERVAFSPVPPLAGLLGITQAQANELYALMVETACPEYASLLFFSSSQYGSAVGADFSVGDCYLSSDFGGVRIPSECSGPHNGEVVAIVEVPEGVRYPSPGEGSMFEVMDSVDCNTPSSEYMGGSPLTNSFQLIAQSKEEFDAGERGLSCSYFVGAPIVVGSVAGQADLLSSVNGMADVAVTTCEHEQFAATLTNNADSDIAVHVSFSQYFPTGSRFGFVLDRIPAGESADYETTFTSPDTATPLDCNPIVTVVPVPLGG